MTDPYPIYISDFAKSVGDDFPVLHTAESAFLFSTLQSPNVRLPIILIVKKPIYLIKRMILGRLSMI